MLSPFMSIVVGSGADVGEKREEQGSGEFASVGYTILSPAAATRVRVAAR